MHRQNIGHSRGSHQKFGRSGDGSSSDGQAHSSSSAGSNKQSRPVIRPSSNPANKVRTPEPPIADLDQEKLPMSPETTRREHSSFTLNGHQISETYKPRRSVNGSSPKALSPVSSPNRTTPRLSPTNSPPILTSSISRPVRTDSPRPRPLHQYVPTQPRRSGTPNWVLKQEYKVKLIGIPKHYWTKDVYFVMSGFGNVTRIDIQVIDRNNNAWVIFQ